METNWKEEMISFNRLAKAGNIFFSVFLWLDVKNSIIYEQTGEETICKTWTPQLYVSGIDLPDFFFHLLFFSTIIKKQPNEREINQDSKISVLHPPVLPLIVETFAYLWHSIKTYKKEKTGLVHMWGWAGGQLLLALLSWASQLNLHI